MMKYRVKYPLRIRSDLTTLTPENSESGPRFVSTSRRTTCLLARADEVIK
jgi:hypothetical protein